MGTIAKPAVTTALQAVQYVRNLHPERQADIPAPWHARIPGTGAHQILAALMASPHFTIDQAENDGTWEATDSEGCGITHAHGLLRHWPTT